MKKIPVMSVGHTLINTDNNFNERTAKSLMYRVNIKKHSCVQELL